MVEDLEKWIDKALAETVPEEILAFCFNLYEDSGDKWSVELVGCGSFDADDYDWACDEITDFGTRDNPYLWNQETSWEQILTLIQEAVQEYLEKGKFAHILKQKEAVGVGFVDGDIELVYQR